MFIPSKGHFPSSLNQAGHIVRQQISSYIREMITLQAFDILIQKLLTSFDAFPLNITTIILQSIYVSSTSQSFPSYILWSPCEIWQQKVPSYDQSKAPKAWVCLNISWFWKVHLFLFNYFCLVLLHNTHNSTKKYSKFMVMESKSTGTQITSMKLIMDTFSQRSYPFREKMKT